MPTVQANGLNFHVNRFRSGPAGKRPVIVFVHGLAVVDNASGSFVLGLHFATVADVISYDLRGHGRSQQAPSGYQVSDHVDDLAALLDGLDIAEPVHLVALSYGGAIAVVAAMRHPERVASVTLLDGLVPIAGWEDSLPGLIGQFEEWVDEGQAHGISEEEVEALIVERSMERFGVSRRRAASAAKRVRRLLQETTLRDDIRSEPAYGKEDYACITCPVLGIYGDASEVYWMSKRLPDLIPHIELHTLPDADHLTVFWSIDKLRPLVRQFLALPDADENRAEAPTTGGDLVAAGEES